MTINWESHDNLALLNPRMATKRARILRDGLRQASHLAAHIFVLTSGSTAQSDAEAKWVCLAKQSILFAAESSNKFLDSNSRDIWLHCLPDFHVGGLGIRARSYLSEAKVVELGENWDASQFVERAQIERASLASLVPTQLYDIVTLRRECPASIRAVLLGGGAVSPNLFRQGLELGWPLLRTYGMSETATQVATELPGRKLNPDEPQLQLLEHLECRSNPEGFLQVRGGSLLTGYIGWHDGEAIFRDPKDPEGWFTTEDRGEVHGNHVKLLGRKADRIKIGGELANLASLRTLLQKVTAAIGFEEQVALFAIPEPRLESIIVMAVESNVPQSAQNEIVAQFNLACMPYEKIRKLITVDSIPRTELRKVKWGDLALRAQAPSTDSC